MDEPEDGLIPPEDRVISPGFSMPLNSTEQLLILGYAVVGGAIWTWNLASWLR